jgi:hypothetical protein
VHRGGCVATTASAVVGPDEQWDGGVACGDNLKSIDLDDEVDSPAAFQRLHTVCNPSHCLKPLTHTPKFFGLVLVSSERVAHCEESVGHAEA